MKCICVISKEGFISWGGEWTLVKRKEFIVELLIKLEKPPTLTPALQRGLPD